MFPYLRPQRLQLLAGARALPARLRLRLLRRVRRAPLLLARRRLRAARRRGGQSAKPLYCGRDTWQSVEQRVEVRVPGL